MKIRTKMPLLIVLLVALPMLLLSVALYEYLSMDFIRKSQENIQRLVEIESERLMATFRLLIKQMELDANQKGALSALEGEKDWIDIRTELFKACTHGGLQDIILKDKEGKVLFGNSSFNPNVKQLYVKKMDENTSISFDTDQKFYIRLEIYHNGRYAGELIYIYDHVIIARAMDRIRLGKTGYAYLLDYEGTLLYHPDRGRIGQKVENEYVKSVLNQIKEGEEIKQWGSFYEYRGIEKYGAVEILPEYDWVLVLTQDLYEIKGPARETRDIIFILWLVFTFIFVVIGIKFSDTITVPLHQLAKTMKEALNGSLFLFSTYKRKDEIGEVADAYNNLIEKLQSNYQELESLFEELSATDEELKAQYDEIQETVENLKLLQEKYSIAIEGTNSGIWEIHLKDGSLYISDEFRDIAGLHGKGPINIYWLLDEIIYPEDKEILMEEYLQLIKRRKEKIHIRVRIKDGNGEIKWILIVGKGMKNEKGEINTLNGIILDVTEQKRYEEYIEYLAYHDPLTQLPNRRMFLDKLSEEIYHGRKGAVMLLDLDNFKMINDTLGHVYGDEVLKKVSWLLGDLSGEKMFISRFGGDEFLILLSERENICEIQQYAEKILSLFQEQLHVGEDVVYMTASMGITLYPDDASDIHQLIMNADTAMYKAKDAGKNKYVFFSHEMAAQLKNKIDVENILREALRENGFTLMYQPQVNIKTGYVDGFEALLRLKNYHVSPAVFIPVAEETGLIKEIGKWVIREAVSQMARWKAQGFDFKRIAINVSPKQLKEENFTAILQEILLEENLPPEYLEIEITESVLLDRTNDTIAIIENLKGLGVQIALDDFGTGYSSLSYLTFIPVDKIKLDKSLNDKFLGDAKVKVIDSLISLAHSLNLKVTAEGIEGMEQYKKLQKGGCDFIQGYFFSRPLTAQEIENIYNKNFLEGMGL